MHLLVPSKALNTAASSRTSLCVGINRGARRCQWGHLDFKPQFTAGATRGANGLQAIASLEYQYPIPHFLFCADRICMGFNVDQNSAPNLLTRPHPFLLFPALPFVNGACSEEIQSYAALDTVYRPTAGGMFSSLDRDRQAQLLHWGCSRHIKRSSKVESPVCFLDVRQSPRAWLGWQHNLKLSLLTENLVVVVPGFLNRT